MKFDISYVCAANLYAILCFISKFQKHNFSFLFYRVKESTSKIIINNISIMQQNLTWLDIWCHLIISYNVLICIKKSIFWINMPTKIHACTLNTYCQWKATSLASVWEIRKYLHLQMFEYIALFEQIVIISTYR